MTKKFVLEVIESIKKRKLVIFCGSGISYDSGIPTVKHIIPPILKKMGLEKKERDKIWNSALPFEAFMQILSENSKPGYFFALLEIFKEYNPNANHIFFAKLASVGLLKVICTTNFDTLIEKAFEDEKLEKGIHYDVFHKEEDFKKINWDDKKIKIIKIHGCIRDKENMVVIMKRVAAQEYSEPRHAIIDQIFANGTHSDVLILGYSCSDAFDLTLQIENVGRGKKQKNILFLKNSTPVSKYFGRIEHVSVQKKKNPFTDFKSGQRLHYKTDKIIKQVWQIIFPNKEFKDIKHIDKESGEQKIGEWIGNFTELIKNNILATVLYEVSEFQNAIRYWEKALKAAITAKDFKNQGMILGNLGLVYRNLGQYKESIKYHKQALDITTKTGDTQKKGSNLGNLGNVYFQIEEYEKAIDHYEQALDIATKIDDNKNKENWFGGIGLIYKNLGKHQEAIKYHKQALRIAKKIGDVKGQGIRLGNIGVVYKNLGQYQKAIKYYKQALDIAIKIGDFRGQEYRFGNIGVVYNNLGQYQEAIKYGKQALEIAEQTGDIRGKGNWLGNLGDAYKNLGWYKMAIDCYKQTLAIFIPMLGKNHSYVKMAEKSMKTAKDALLYRS